MIHMASDSTEKGLEFLKILQSRLTPTIGPIKRGIASEEGSREGGRNFSCCLDGKRN